MTDEQLIRKIRDVALLRGQFTLRSGRTSHYYLDKYLFETQPDILEELGKRLASHVVDGAVDRVAGTELGGIPLVCATSIACGKPALLIRNQKKGYGTERLIEGKLNRGDRILLLEDVVTTGGQIIETTHVLREAGAEIVGIVAVLDRNEGGRGKYRK